LVNGDKENTIFLAALRKNANSGKIVACNDGTYSVYSSRFKAFDTLDVVEAVSDTSENILFILTRNRRIWSWKKDILVLLAMM
jgi:hypothetical protein